MMIKFNNKEAIRLARIRIESGVFLETLRGENESVKACIDFFRKKRKFSTGKLKNRIG